MREIELKYRVDDLEALLLALKSQGIELSEPVFQDDQAYAPAGWQFGDSKLGVSFLRLRTVPGCHYFTLKQPAASAQDCLEYETQVTDRQAMHQAALHMGYRPTVRITKTRRTATLEDCLLCVNEVTVQRILKLSAWPPITPTPRPSRPTLPFSSARWASRPPDRPDLRLAGPRRSEIVPMRP